MEKTEEEILKDIKILRNDLIKVYEENLPEVYMMPKGVWNRVIEKLAYYDEALENCRKGRDNWRAKFYELKKK